MFIGTARTKCITTDETGESYKIPEAKSRFIQIESNINIIVKPTHQLFIVKSKMKMSKKYGISFFQWAQGLFCIGYTMSTWKLLLL